MTDQIHRCIVRSAVLLAALLATGCAGESGSDSMIAEANQTNLQRLSNLYAFYQAKNDWWGPADQEEFRQFISRLDATTMERMGIDPNAIDDLFKSERDGQPFHIVYEVEGSMRGVVAPIIFEQTGVDGLRMVAFTAAAPREVDTYEYQRLMEDGVGQLANTGRPE